MKRSISLIGLSRLMVGDFDGVVGLVFFCCSVAVFARSIKIANQAVNLLENLRRAVVSIVKLDFCDVLFVEGDIKYGTCRTSNLVF